MSKNISQYFPGAATSVNITSENQTTFVAGDVSNTFSGVQITNAEIAANGDVGDTIDITVDGVTTTVIITDITGNVVTTNGDIALRDAIGTMGATVTTVLNEQNTVWEGIAEGLVIENPNGDPDPIAAIRVVTITADQYEMDFPGGVGADPNILYLLSDEQID